MTEPTKFQKLSALDTEHQKESDTLSRQLSLEVTVTMATLVQEKAKESTDKEIQCALNCIKKVLSYVQCLLHGGKKLD